MPFSILSGSFPSNDILNTVGSIPSALHVKVARVFKGTRSLGTLRKEGFFGASVGNAKETREFQNI